jgi:glutathione synthase/RimK-type ligase-like ATP-grasp enzyme
MNIAFLYEHPSWSDTLLEAFQAKAIELKKINVAELSFETEIKGNEKFDLAINRINIMPSEKRKPEVVFQALHYLNWLELSGVHVVNGARSHFIGASKAMQNGIFSSLGLHCPKAIAIYRVEDSVSAAEKIGYPVIIKPNLGGSGAGVAKYDNFAELRAALKIKSVDLGVDRTGIVQEYIESDGFVYRIEILGDQLFYSIRQPIQEGSFNYCAADGCSADMKQVEESDPFDFCVIGEESRIEVYKPERAILDNVIKIIKSCSADVGGVEFLLDKKSGLPCYYDFNPYSNFVSNGESLLGFSPEQKYISFISDLLHSNS